jgi:hypothetical protein
VYLERCAVAMGLNPDLHVTVHRGEPDGVGNPENAQPGSPRSQDAQPRDARSRGSHRVAGPVAVVPKPSPSPDGQPGAVAGGPPATCTARGSGPLKKFALTVRAPEGAACAWEPAISGPADGLNPGPGLADIEDQLRSGWEEPTALFGARLRAIAACLASAGTPAASPVVADIADDDGWLLLRVAGASMACTVVEITGVPCAVAISIMTRDPSPVSEPGSHARRPGAAEPGVGSPASAGTGATRTGSGGRRSTTRGRTAIQS